MAMSAPYNSNSYFYALHEYDYLFCDYEDDDLVSVSEITKPTITEIFKSTHNYVTNELKDNIISNSQYKYLDELKSKVYNVLDQFNKIYNESLLNNNIIDSYTKYSNVVNNLDFSFKQYIRIPKIGNTIYNISSIVNDRRRYIIHEKI